MHWIGYVVADIGGTFIHDPRFRNVRLGPEHRYRTDHDSIVVMSMDYYDGERNISVLCCSTMDEGFSPFVIFPPSGLKSPILTDFLIYDEKGKHIIALYGSDVVFFSNFIVQRKLDLSQLTNIRLVKLDSSRVAVFSDTYQYIYSLGVEIDKFNSNISFGYLTPVVYNNLFIISTGRGMVSALSEKLEVVWTFDFEVQVVEHGVYVIKRMNDGYLVLVSDYAVSFFHLSERKMAFRQHFSERILADTLVITDKFCVVFSESGIFIFSPFQDSTAPIYFHVSHNGSPVAIDSAENIYFFDSFGFLNIVSDGELSSVRLTSGPAFGVSALQNGLFFYSDFTITFLPYNHLRTVSMTPFCDTSDCVLSENSDGVTLFGQGIFSKLLYSVGYFVPVLPLPKSKLYGSPTRVIVHDSSFYLDEVQSFGYVPPRNPRSSGPFNHSIAIMGSYSTISQEKLWGMNMYGSFRNIFVLPDAVAVLSSLSLTLLDRHRANSSSADIVGSPESGIGDGQFLSGDTFFFFVSSDRIRNFDILIDVREAVFLEGANGLAAVVYVSHSVKYACLSFVSMIGAKVYYEDSFSLCSFSEPFYAHSLAMVGVPGRRAIILFCEGLLRRVEADQYGRTSSEGGWSIDLSHLPGVNFSATGSHPTPPSPEMDNDATPFREQLLLFEDSLNVFENHVFVSFKGVLFTIHVETGQLLNSLRTYPPIIVDAMRDTLNQRPLSTSIPAFHYNSSGIGGRWIRGAFTFPYVTKEVSDTVQPLPVDLHRTVRISALSKDLVLVSTRTSVFVFPSASPENVFYLNISLPRYSLKARLLPLNKLLIHSSPVIIVDISDVVNIPYLSDTRRNTAQLGIYVIISFIFLCFLFMSVLLLRQLSSLKNEGFALVPSLPDEVDK